MTHAGTFAAIGLSLVTFAALNIFIAGGIGVAGRALGLTDAASGLILSLGALAGMLVAPLWGIASDLWGRRRTLLLAVPMLSLAAAILAVVFQTESALALAGLVLGRLLHAVFGAAIIPASQALTADLTTQARRTGGMAAMSATLGLGSMAGSLLLAVTAKSGLQTGFAILGGTGLLAVAMTILFLTDQQGQRVRPATPTRLPLGLLWPNLLVTVAGFSTYTMILPLHGLRLLDQGGRSFGQANAEAGWVLLAGGSTVFLAQASITLLKDPDPRRLLCVGSMGALPAIVALALSHSVVTMALAAAFMGGCLGLMAAANLAVISLKVEQDIQGKAAGVNAALRDLGIAIGPMIGLGLYQPGGFLPFAVGFVMIGIILLASFRT